MQICINVLVSSMDLLLKIFVSSGVIFYQILSPQEDWQRPLREGKLSNPRARAACAPCMEKIYENLRKPPRARLAGAIYWLPTSQVYSR